MNRFALAAAMSLSSLIAPLAAHADPFHGRAREPGFTRPAYVAPVVARPVFVQRDFAPRPLFVHRGAHASWRMQRAHEIRDGRIRFEHGRR